MILYQVPLEHAQKPLYKGKKYKIKLPAVSDTAQHYWQTATSNLCLLSGSSNKSKHPAACRALSEYTMPVQADLFRTMTSTWRVLQLILLCTFCKEYPWNYEMFPDVSGKEKNTVRQGRGAHLITRVVLKRWSVKKQNPFEDNWASHQQYFNYSHFRDFWLVQQKANSLDIFLILPSLWD